MDLNNDHYNAINAAIQNSKNSTKIKDINLIGNPIKPEDLEKIVFSKNL